MNTVRLRWNPKPQARASQLPHILTFPHPSKLLEVVHFEPALEGEEVFYDVPTGFARELLVKEGNRFELWEPERLTILVADGLGRRTPVEFASQKGQPDRWTGEPGTGAKAEKSEPKRRVKPAAQALLDAADAEMAAD